MDEYFDEIENNGSGMPQWTRDIPQRQNTHPNKTSNKKHIAIALLCSLLGGIIGSYITHFLKTPQNTSQVLQGQRETTLITSIPIDTSRQMSPAEVYAANVGSTVGITTSVTTNFWGFPTTSAASGSGFILTEDGYILTNHHVIDGFSTITVSTFDGKSYDAQLVGYDEGNDIAVLKVEATDLVPVIIGDSENTNVGDSVVAIGNPLGELTFSLTAGAISALDREVTMSNGITMNLIQTDCAINSGNSGGALFNLYGEVIGITNAKYSSSSNNEASIDNIGFAIPMNDVWDMIESIIEKGYVVKPYIGISVLDVSKETQSYGLPQGAAVRAVSDDSPAKAAGLEVSDIITHVDDKSITGSKELIRIIGQTRPKDTLRFTIYRKGTTIQLDVTVGQQVQSVNGKQENITEVPLPTN